MNRDYSSYLLAIALIILAIAGGIAFFAKAGSKKRESNRTDSIRGGSVSVFFDRTGNVTVIPYIKDKFGSGKATADVIFLKSPYNATKLGSAIRAAMGGCAHAASCTDRELFEKLGACDWSIFSENKRNISIYYNEKYGIIFNTTRRKTDGAYVFNHNGIEKSLPPDADDETLGSVALELLRLCR